MHGVLVRIHLLQKGLPTLIEAPPTREALYDLLALCLPRVYHEKLQQSRIQNNQRSFYREKRIVTATQMRQSYAS